jgi:hypothetical protein
MPFLKTFFRNLIVDKLNVASHFSIGGTEVTATAAELNAVDGISGTVTQLNSLTDAAGTVSFDKLVKVKVVSLFGAGSTAFSFQHAEATAIIVHRLIVDVTTKTDGACTLDCGFATASSTTNDSLIDGLDVGAAAGTFDNIQNPGSNGKPLQKVAVSSWVNGRVASGALTGLVGKVYIHYTVCS